MLLLNWLTPFGFSVGLAYVHPLMALWILDRELFHRRPEWRRAYHGCLCCLPLLLGWLWWRLANEPPLGAEDTCWLGGVECAGAEILPGVSSRFLVAALAFLVLLHYCVWVAAFPLVGQGSAPWQLRNSPGLAVQRLAHRSGVAAGRGGHRRGADVGLPAGRFQTHAQCLSDGLRPIRPGRGAFLAAGLVSDRQ